MGAVALGIAFVVFLFYTIISQGLLGFRQSYVKLEVSYDPAAHRSGRHAPGADARRSRLRRAHPREPHGALFPDVEGRTNLRQLYALVSSGAAFELQRRVESDPRSHRQHRDRVGPGERRRRHVSEGTHSPASDAGGFARRSATSSSAGSTGWSNATLAELRFNTPVLHLGRLARARAGRRLGRGGGLVLHAARDAAVVIPDRRRRGDLPRGVRAEESLDGPHRGQHQQPGGGALDRIRPARVWPCSSISSACRVRPRWWAAWC